MKRYILYIFATFLFADVSAQIKLQIAGANPKPTSRLSDWALNKNIFTILATGGSGLPETPVKFKVELKEGGAVVGSTNLATAPTFIIASGRANIFNAGDVLALQSMVFTGDAKNALTKTGRLPEGNYELCIRAVNPTDFSPASEITCINFFITSYQLPILLSPANESDVDITIAKTAIIFRWTPLVPTPTEATSYLLQVFEVMEKQTPLQAMRANQPLLNKEIKGVTQYVWQPQLDFTNSYGAATERMTRDTSKPIGPDTEPDLKANAGKTFIWTIQTIDRNGNGFNNGVGDGRSEPFVFFVRKKR
jgi:hypothetical protein